ncbi:MAG: SUMF1/EgtB/PvdO family nonheme iron enzyme [Cyanobacteria bacterium P01_A01_bin.123]
MNNENKQSQANKTDSSSGSGTIDELLALKKEMAGRIEEIVAHIEQNYDRRLEDAILFLAGSGDGENLEDSIGFNRSDSRFGHSLARHLQSGAMLTVKQAHTALQMMQKYSDTQLEPNGYSLPRTWAEISHQYREREIEINPYRLYLGLHKDEGHEACIAIRYPDNVESEGIEESLEGSAGIEDGERWPVWSDNWDYGYPLRRAEALLPSDGDDWYVDLDIEAAYYLWQEKQKAGIGAGISVTFSRSANSSESSSNDTVDPMGDVPLEMVYVPQGEFLMGSPETELERSKVEGPQHSVTISAFYMGKYPITQRQWRVVSLLDPVDIPLEHAPSQFMGDDLPVEQVIWNEAVEFCKRLSKHTGDHYRLPSEAEWEYACRATQDGMSTPFYFGETISTEQANYSGRYSSYGKGEPGVSRGKTTKVGSFPANAFGLHDMHGNVLEWCEDVWHNNYEGAPTDGSAWVEGGEQSDTGYAQESQRILRGGYWGRNPEYCRSASRASHAPGYCGTNFSLGFRVVCSSSVLLSEVEETLESFSRSATSSESSANDTVDPMGDVPPESATASESSSNDTVDPTGDVPPEMAPNVLQSGDYSGVWHGHDVRFSIQQIFPTGQFNGVGEFVGGPHSGIQFGFMGKTDSDGRLTISRDVGIGSQVVSDANFEIDGDKIVWQGLTKGVGIGDAGLPFEFRAQSIDSERISALFSRSATASESSSNDTVDPMGDVPLEMVKKVLRPGDYSGVWHDHAVKFSIQQVFPAGQLNGVGEFVGGPHSGIQFGFTGRTASDGRLTISRDVGIGSQVASDANFEIDGDSIVWQGLTQGPGIGHAGLPFEFRAQSIDSERIDHGPSKVKGDDLPVEKARMPLLYQVENQWGGNNAPWHNGGTWVMGCRHNQNIVAINIKSDDGGKTFHGNMTYADEGPIGFRATLSDGNNYAVENQWGGDNAPWHNGGQWIIGGRSTQNVIELKVKSDDGGNTLNGTMTYEGEGPIGFKGL